MVFKAQENGRTELTDFDHVESLLGAASTEDDALLVAAFVDDLWGCGTRSHAVKRVRKSFDDVAQEYGNYFDRACRMGRSSFTAL